MTESTPFTLRIRIMRNTDSRRQNNQYIFFITQTYLSKSVFLKIHSTNGVVDIRDKQELLLSSDAAVFRQQISIVLDHMREELDDHRLAINENTTELSATNEFLNELNRRLDRITERIDDLTLCVKGVQSDSKFELQSLSGKEKEVFHALYILTETQPYVSYEQLARKTLLTKELVMNHVTGMIQKGVPVLKRYDGSVVFLKLDPMFRELQAKKNVIGLNALLTGWLR
ncbi:hypothetical protein J4211_06020 [Candidatus Woesearchaeota archaeon]|nr:hypothetical protein [Candidatus Woesearchaeota archaeon]